MKINAAVGFVVNSTTVDTFVLFMQLTCYKMLSFFCLDMQLCFYFELPVFMLRIMCELGILFTRFSYFYYIYVM